MILTAVTLTLVCILSTGLAAPVKDEEEKCIVRLYEDPDGEGQVVQTEIAVEDLQALDFEGKLSSLKVFGPCRWIFYTKPGFEGKSAIFEPGAYAALDEKDDLFSSLRPLPADGSIAVVLFDGPNFCGSAMVLTNEYNRLESMGFNDKAKSFIVTGGKWVLCQHAWEGFEGYSKEVEKGDYRRVFRKLRRRISLVRIAKE